MSISIHKEEIKKECVDGLVKGGLLFGERKNIFLMTRKGQKIKK